MVFPLKELLNIFLLCSFEGFDRKYVALKMMTMMMMMMTIVDVEVCCFEELSDLEVSGG